ncbi:MAG: Fpg/Nei family DNA glycosylase [Mycobacteriales bacterium]
MPELPEVQALARQLDERARGLVVARIDVLAVNALKTHQPPPAALVGRPVDCVVRRGKFLDLSIGGLHLVIHLARAGWLRWTDQLPTPSPKPGRGPLALRVNLGGPGFDLTEAGTRKGLAVYVVTAVEQVPGLAALGRDPLEPGFDRAELAAILAGQSGHLKSVLRDQQRLAGIGNAYSDEILHAARLSPFKPAGRLSAVELERLYQAVGSVLSQAVSAAAAVDLTQLKEAKRAGMRVHGRAGEPCPTCGDRIRTVSFVDSSLQYCPSCQTGGAQLADRRLSRLIR